MVKTTLFLSILLVAIAVVIYLRRLQKLYLKQYQELFSIWRQIESALETRHSLAEAMVGTAAAYEDFEKETLESVQRALRRVADSEGLSSRFIAEKNLTQALMIFKAVSASYPDFQTNRSVLEYRKQLLSLESRTENLRRAYNKCVTEIDRLNQSFMQRVIAKFFGLVPVSELEPFI